VPLADGYGVVIGSLKKHWIDPPDTQGRWPHYNMTVETTAGEYHCVVNLKSRSEVKVEYRDFRSAGTTSFASVLAKSNGFHPLPRTSTSGALDFIRHPGLQDQPGCSCTHWLKENGVNLMQLMEYYLIGAQRVLVFGEPYATGLGIHNVHMNQEIQSAARSPARTRSGRTGESCSSTRPRSSGCRRSLRGSRRSPSRPTPWVSRCSAGVRALP